MNSAPVTGNVVRVVSVEPCRGLRKERGRLVVVPDEESYIIHLMLDDGRPAFLTGRLGEALASTTE
jgi:hypothetical protein